MQIQATAIIVVIGKKKTIVTMKNLPRYFIRGLDIDKDVVLLLRYHALSIIGVERQLAQADRLVQFAVGHLIQIHSDTTTKAL